MRLRLQRETRLPRPRSSQGLGISTCVCGASAGLERACLGPGSPHLPTNGTRRERRHRPVPVGHQPRLIDTNHRLLDNGNRWTLVKHFLWFPKNKKIGEDKRIFWHLNLFFCFPGIRFFVACSLCGFIFRTGFRLVPVPGAAVFKSWRGGRGRGLSRITY